MDECKPLKLGHAAYHREDADGGDGDASPGARHALALPAAAAAAADADDKGAAAARLGDVENIYGDCDTVDDQVLLAFFGIGYMGTLGSATEPNAFRCPGGYAMTSWKVVDHGCSRGSSRSYTQCRDSAGLNVGGKLVETPLPWDNGDGNCWESTTSWEVINSWEYSLSNMGKFSEEVQCSTDHFMTDWRFAFPADKRYQHGRITFTCCKSTLPLKPVFRSGRCDDTRSTSSGSFFGMQYADRGNMLRFLATQSPACNPGEIMTGWSIQPGCGASGKVQATASCAAIPGAPPPSPAPPPPLPSPPPFPPPPAYLQNGVAVKVFHLTTRVKKPLSIQGINMNSMDLDMDCFKNDQGFYYKGVLSADADIGANGVNLNAAGVFNFDTTSGELVLELTIELRLTFGPFKVIGKMRRKSKCDSQGTVISGSIQVQAGAFLFEGVTVVLTQYCMDDDMTIIDLTGTMTNLKIMDGVVLKDMSMSLVGVRASRGGSAELENLDWTGTISGTLAFETDGMIKIPGAVGAPTLAVTTAMTLKRGVFDYQIRAKGTAALALGVGITASVTMDAEIPCKTGRGLHSSTPQLTMSPLFVTEATGTVHFSAQPETF